MINNKVVATAEKSDEQPPKFWKTWRRFYTIQLVYWFVLLVLMIIGTRVLNR